MSTWKTTGVWDPLPTPEQVSAILVKIDEMMAQGKTTHRFGTSYPNPGGPTVNTAPMTVVREWPQQAYAQEWIDWIEQFAPVDYVLEEVPA